MPRIPPVTRGLLAAFIGLSILAQILGPWLGAFDLGGWLVLVPGDVLNGEIWRIATYPFVTSDPMSLLFGGLVLYWAGRDLESSWGSRFFLRRVAVLVLLPAALVCLLSAVISPLQDVPVFGMASLVTALIVAWACENRDRQIMIFPLPMALGGDQLLMLEGVMLAVWVLFSHSIFAQLVHITSFGVALAWFRFDVLRDVRRSYLRSRKASLEKRVEKLSNERHLRLVRDDDPDDDPKKKGPGPNGYLH